MARPRFALGERVRIQATVEKTRTERGHVTWERKPLPVTRSSGKSLTSNDWEHRERPHAEGVVIGQRLLTDYEVGKESDWDELTGRSYSWTTTTPVKGTGRRAFIVAFALHRKPVMVLDEDIEPMEDPDLLVEGLEIIERTYGTRGFHGVHAVLREVSAGLPPSHEEHRRG